MVVLDEITAPLRLSHRTQQVYFISVINKTILQIENLNNNIVSREVRGGTNSH